MRDRFLVRFWGVRGTIPTPGSKTIRFGGNTPCIEVRCGDRLIILDAGSGLRELGNSLIDEMPIDAVLLLSTESPAANLRVLNLRGNPLSDYSNDIYIPLLTASGPKSSPPRSST